MSIEQTGTLSGSENDTINEIKAVVPEYRNSNSEWLINKLLSDDTFLQDAANKIMTRALESDPEFRNKYLSDDKKKNEENYMRDFNSFKANLRRSIIRPLTTGQDTQEAVVNRDLSMRLPTSNSARFTGTANATDYKAIVIPIIAREENRPLMEIPDDQILQPYKDARGRSIGFGHYLKPEEEAGNYIQVGNKRVPIASFTKKDALELKSLDVDKHYVEAIDTLRNKGVDVDSLNVNQRAAIADIAYNAGSGALGWTQIVEPFKEYQRTGDGTKLKNAIKALAVTEQGGDGTPLPGLVRRRSEAAELFFKNVGAVNPARRVNPTNPTTDKPDLPINQFRDIVVNNKDTYASYNLVDGEGNFIYDNDTSGNLLFNQQILNNEELRNKLFKDRYSLFQEEMTKSHNLMGGGDSDTEGIARAYAVWSKFGSQGLTQYVNMVQSYDSSKGVNEQSSRWLMANEFMNRRVNGYSPNEWVDEFLGSEESEFGRMEINPAGLPSALARLTPKDYNGFSQNFYALTGNAYTQVSDNSVAVKLLQGFGLDTSPENVNEASRGMGGVYKDLVSRVEANYKKEDLYQTVTENAEIITIDGGEAYKISNFLNQPLKVRLAVDALDFSGEFRDFVYFDKDNPDDMIIDVDRFEKFRKNMEDVATGSVWSARNLYRNFNSMLSKETVASYDEQGNFLGMKEQVGGGFGADVWNTAILGGMQFANYYYKFFPDLAANLVTRAADDRDLDRVYEQTFGEMNLAFDMMNQDVLGSDAGLLPKAAIYGGTMINYIRAMRFYGGHVMSGVAGASRMATVGSQARALSQATTLAGRAQSMGKWANWGQALKARSLATGIGSVRLLAGEKVINFGEREHETLFGSDALPMVGEWLGNKVGLSQESQDYLAELSRAYKRSDYATQMFADTVTSIGLSILFDGVFNGLRPSVWKGKVGWVESLESVSFGREVSRYMKEMSDDYAEAQFRSFPGSELTKTLTETSKADDFVQGTSKYFTTLREDIENTLKYYDESLGGKARTPQELAEVADRIYQSSIDGLAESMSQIFKSDPDAALSSGLIGVGKSMMDAAKSTVRDPEGLLPEQMVKNGDLSPAEALEIRKGGLNRIIINGNTPDTYKVVELYQNLWAIDLGEALIKKAMNLDKADIIKSTIAKAGGTMDSDVLTALSKNLDEFLNETVENGTKRLIKRNDDGTFDYIDPLDNSSTGVKQAAIDDDEIAKLFQQKILRGDITESEYAQAAIDYFPKSDSVFRKNIESTMEPIEPLEAKVQTKAREKKAKVVKEDTEKMAETAKRGSSKKAEVLDMSSYVGKKVKDSGGEELTVEKASGGKVFVRTKDDTMRTYSDEMFEELVKQGKITVLGEEVVKEAIDLSSYVGKKMKASNGTPYTITKVDSKNVHYQLRDGTKGSWSVKEFESMLDKKRIQLVLEKPEAPVAAKVADAPRVYGVPVTLVNALRKLTKVAMSSEASVIEKMTNFVINLGVDSIATLKTRIGKRHVYGNNAVSITDYDPIKGAGSGVPKGMIVRIKNGTGMEFFYRANKETKLPPSKWTLYGDKLNKNADWDQLNVNQTLKEDGVPNFFVLDSTTGLYRLAVKGDKGVGFLNIQNAELVTPKSKETLSDVYIHDNNIDARIRIIDGKEYYELIDPSSQFVPTEKAFEHIPQVMTYKGKPVKELPKGKKVKETPAEAVPEKEPKGMTREDLIKQGRGVKTLDLNAKPVIDRKTGRRVDDMILPVGLAISAAVADHFFGSDDDFGAQSAGIGMLLGLGVTRKAFAKGMVRPGSVDFVSATKKVADHIDSTTAKEIKMEGTIKSTEDIVSAGFAGNRSNAAEVSKFRNYWEQVKESYAKGRTASGEIIDMATHNRLVKSMLSEMTGISETATKLRDLLFVHPHQGSKMLSRFKEAVSREVGGIGAITRIENSLNAKAKDLMIKAGMDANDASAYTEWNLALWRVLNGGTKIKDGALAWDTNVKNVDELYNQKAMGEFYKALDQNLLNDADFLAYHNGIKNTFREIKKEWLSELERHIDRSLTLFESNVVANTTEMTTRVRRLMKQYMLDERFRGMTQTQFKETLEKESDIAAFTFLKKLPSAEKDRLFDLHLSRRKFTEVGDNYLPQLLNKEKITNILNKEVVKLMKENPKLSRANATSQGEEMLLRQFADANSKKIKGLKFFDEEIGELRERDFSSFVAAKKELQKVYDQLDFNTQLEWTAVGYDSFIQTKKITISKGGKNRTQTKFFVSLPDRYSNIEFLANKEEISKQFEAFKAGTMIKNSNFLERPRTYNIPAAWAETDIDKVLYRYSQDAGPRMHLMKNDLYDGIDVDNQYINKIKAELIKKGIDQNTSTDLGLRAKSIYNTQTGIMAELAGMTNAEKLAHLKNKTNFERVSKTVRNVTFAPFGYFISFLDTFQSLNLGPILSSYDSVGKTWKNFTFNKQALANAEDVTKNFGLSLRTLDAYKAGNQFDDELLNMYGTDNYLLSKAEKYADAGASAVAGASITKGIAAIVNKVSPLKMSVENWGMARLIFGDFYSVNSVSTTINWISGVLEAQKMVSLYKQLLEVDPATGAPKNLRVEGMGLREVKEKLMDLGIREGRISNFVERSTEFNELAGKILGTEEFNYNMALKMPDLYNDLGDIATTMTGKYHGKNKMLRPELWSTKEGRLLSQFAVYPFNFALQATQKTALNKNSVFNTFTQFNNDMKAGKYGTKLASKEMGRIEGARLLHYFNTGDWNKLKSLGFTDEAIRDFPVSAYANILKIVGAISVGTASFITRDAIADMMYYPVEEVMADATGREPEQWQRMKNRTLVNPYAPEDQQISWSQLIDGTGMEPNDFFLMVRAGIGYASDTGVFGGWSTPFSPFAAKDGFPAYSAPVSLTNRMVKRFARVANSDLQSFPETLRDETAMTVFEIAPFVGTFRRNTLANYNALTEQASYSGFKVSNGDTGEMLNLKDFALIQ